MILNNLFDTKKIPQIVKLHGIEVDVGTIVYHPIHGKGVIIEISYEYYRKIKAEFPSAYVYVREDGFNQSGDKYASLYLEPVTVG